MTPSADERARARRRALLQRRLLVGARRSERLSAPPAADHRAVPRRPAPESPSGDDRSD